MTPVELRAMADKIEEEQQIVKIGFLTKDLYRFCSDESNGLVWYKPYPDFWLLDLSQKKSLIEDFESQFLLALKKGTKFVCYLIDGEECWSDDVNYGLENMDAKWALKYLENIQNAN